MTPEGPPGGQAADGASGAAGARFPAQPSPTAQSVLWRPTVQELARPDSDATLIFVAQRALAAVEDHLLSAPDQALLGYLVGRVLESPESGLPYLVVHGAVRVPQMIVSGASEQVVAQSLAAVQRMLPPEDGVVVGWYRSDPTGALKISASDHAAHTRHFPRSWQIALLLTSGPAGTRGGFFRPAGDAGAPVPYLPFYELLDPESYRDGAKEPRISWSTYWSPDTAVWRARAEQPRAPRGRRPRGLGLVDRGRGSDRRGGGAGRAPGAPSRHACRPARGHGLPRPGLRHRSGRRRGHRRPARRRRVPAARHAVRQPPDDVPRPGNGPRRRGRGVAGLHAHVPSRRAGRYGRRAAGAGPGGERAAGGRRFRALGLPPALT